MSAAVEARLTSQSKPTATIDLSLPKPIYHEKQSLMRCGVHTLNNLFQSREYDAFSFDAICEQLTPDAWINPHRSLLGLGNYDINVLIAALQRHSYNTHWHDRRQPVASIALERISALLVNTTSARLLGLYSTQHWYAVRAFAGGGEWWNLNSQLRAPERVADVVAYCEAALKDERTQLLLVAPQQWERQQLYETADK